MPRLRARPRLVQLPPVPRRPPAAKQHRGRRGLGEEDVDHGEQSVVQSYESESESTTYIFAFASSTNF